MTGTEDNLALPPVRRSVLIPADVDHCWAGLVNRIGVWWPMVGHSCTDDPRSTVAFVEGDLVETGPDGAHFVWGTVTRWEPPTGLVMTWHPGLAVEKTDAATAEVTEVEWRLTVLDRATTLVEVLHRGWENRSDPRGSRTAYDGGWPEVVAALAAELEIGKKPEA